MEPFPPTPPAAPPPAARKNALAFFGVLLALYLPGIVAQAVLLPAGLAWTELSVFLLPALVATAGSNLRAGPWLRLAWPGPSRLVLGALAGGAGFLVAAPVMALAQRLAPASWVKTFDPALLFAGPAWRRAFLVAVAVLLAPPCEEIAFRGYLQSALGLRRRPAAAIGGAAFLFALMHLDPIRFPALLLLGALFGWLTWRSGSIWPAIAAHSANNAITSALVLVFGVDAQEPGTAPLAAILSTMAVGAAALVPPLLAFRALTPRPPLPADAVVLRDPERPGIRFSAARVPPGLAGVAFALGALLGAILLVAGFVAGRPAP